MTDTEKREALDAVIIESERMGNLAKQSGNANATRQSAARKARHMLRDLAAEHFAN